MGYSSLNTEPKVISETPIEQKNDDDGLSFLNWLIDGFFFVAGLVAAPFTGGLSLAAQIGIETAIAATNAAVDAGIDAARGKIVDVPYEFAGVILAPLGIIGGQATKLALGSRNAIKTLQKAGYDFTKDDLGGLLVKIGKGAFANEIPVKESESFNQLIKRWNNAIKEQISSFKSAGEFVAAKDAKEQLIFEVGTFQKIASHLASELYDIENQIKAGLLKGLKLRSAIRRLFLLLLDYFINLNKIYKIIENPFNFFINEAFRIFNRFLSRSGYFRYLRKLEQNIAKKWFKGNKSILGVVNFLRLRTFNLLPMPQSEWILGCRLIQHRIGEQATSDWPRSDLQIVFNAQTTAHWGERGAHPEPWGKRAITVRNITKKEYEDFIAADSPGRYYLDKFALKNRSHDGWQLLDNLVHVVPGLSFVTELHDKIVDIRQIFSKSFQFHSLTNIVGKLVNKTARLLTFRNVRFLVRTITYQIYRPDRVKLTQQLARQLGLKFSRSSLAINTHGGQFSRYKKHRSTLKKLRGW